MNRQDLIQETEANLHKVIDAWCPEAFRFEPNQHRMMRALLNLNAYMMDVSRCQKGEQPIRTDYPVPLPAIAEK